MKIDNKILTNIERLNKQIIESQDELDRLGLKILNNLESTIVEYLKNKPEYAVGLLSKKFTSDMLYIGGLDYFSWNGIAKIQSDFKESCEFYLNKDKTKYLFHNDNYFSRIKVKTNWTDRYVHEEEKFSFDGQSNLLYTSHRAIYNGFNNLVDSATQRLSICLKENKIIDSFDSSYVENVRKFLPINLEYNFITTMLNENV